MKKALYILLLSPFFFISSCEEVGEVHGCLDSQACNYNSEATIDNNSCEYAVEGYDCGEIPGCMDENSLSYNADANVNVYCCYNCYDNGGLIGNYCGYNVNDVFEDNFTGLFHCWSLNGTFVPPNTFGAVPAFNADITAVYCDWSDYSYYVDEVNCY